MERLSSLWQMIGREKVLPGKETDSNPFRKMLLNAYRQGDFDRALLLMKGRNKVAGRYRKVFGKVRTFFKN
ncbi:MAG: hypothetical protein U5K84_06615 [Alkalibacterium sp.]|nr:hypothetical protein [Alkalibacterium sp.]